MLSATTEKYSLPRFRRVQRVHSTFEPSEFDIERLGPYLSDCRLIQQILQAPCNERLYQSRYNEIIVEKTISFSNGHSLTYSIINSIMTNLIKTTTKNACVAGRIQLYMFGNPDSRSSRVIENATLVNLTFPKACSRAQLVFVPLNVRWIESRNVAQRAQNLGQDFTCYDECQEGHSMSLIINEKDKTLEYYEPNGITASWYNAIQSYLERLFQTIPKFKNYTWQYTLKCLPSTVGVQQLAGLPMCVFFSNLYAAIRLLCPNIPEEAVIIELLALNRRGIVKLLQRFYCFLVEYAQSTGLFEATSYLENTYRQVVNKLNNFRRYQSRAKHDKSYYVNLLARVEIESYNDILNAARILRKINKELY